MTQAAVIQDRRTLIVKANEIQYFSILFCYRTLYVSDRFTVHHQESYYCSHSKRYLST